MTKDHKAELHPLTPGQKALWTSYKLSSDSGAYNMSYVWEVDGLDLEIFNQVLETLTQRIPMWRSRFVEKDGDVFIEVQQGATANFVYRPLSPHEQSNLPEFLTQLIAYDFDLEEEPPVKWLAFEKVPGGAQILILLMHHAATDVWSVMRMLNDLKLLYAAASEGQTCQLDPLENSPQDFTDNLHAYFKSPKSKEASDFWHQTLQDLPDPLHLPTDHPRSPMLRYGRRCLEFPLNEDIHKALEGAITETGHSPFRLFLAAYQIFLARYCGQDDVLVGVPTAGRAEEYGDLFGYYVSPVVMRAQVQNQSFKQFLDTHKGFVKQALSHQEYPFPLVVSQLDIERDQSRTPVFQTQFIYENPNRFENREQPLVYLAQGNQEIWDLSPMEWRRILMPLTLDPFDLTMKVVKVGSQFYGIIEYRNDLFTQNTIEAISANFCALLHNLFTRPESNIMDAGLLDGDARTQILQAWNDTATDYTGLPVTQIIQGIALKNEDHEVLQYTDSDSFLESTLTYKQLVQSANQLAHFLIAKGVSQGDYIGVYVERSPEMVIALLGIMQAGGIYLPLDPKFPGDRLAYMMEDAGAAFVLTQQKLMAGMFVHKATAIPLDEAWAEISQHPVSDPHIPVGPEDSAYIIYTSGSTGKPKGVQITHGNLVNFLESMAAQPGFQNADTLLAVTTLSFDIAGLELYLPLIQGGRLIITPSSTAMDGEQLLSIIARHKVTVMQATPITWRLMLEAGWTKSSMKVLCGGEPLPPELAEQILARCDELWNMYGPTETTIWSTVHRIKQDEFPISIGKPIANTQVYILDKRFHPMPRGVSGELLIGGDGLAMGYLNRPHLTAQQFVPDPFANQPGQRMYRTGDLARWRNDGTLECLGRIDHQVKVRGYRIELGEIESTLAKHPLVAEAVVIVREDVPGDPRLVGYLIPAETDAIDLKGITDQIKEHLPAYMVPSAFVIMEKFPLTPNKKINRKALPAPDVQQVDHDQFVAPRNETETQIAGIWSAILGVSQVGVYDDFFRLGGHSLIATKVASHMRQDMGADIHISDIFHFPTVATLAERVAEVSQNTFEPIPSRDGNAPLAPTKAQTQLWFIDQLSPGEAAYNIPVTYFIEGPLDMARFKWALEQVIQRHEALRTCFLAVDGSPQPEISPQLSWELQVQDFSTEPNPMASAEAWILQECLQPFTLVQAPLFRFSVLKLGATEHVLAGVVHHIIFDGWSIGVLIQDLLSFFQDNPPKPLEIQYGDYAPWHNQRLQDDQVQQQVSYWRNKLEGAQTVLELPADQTRPPGITFDGSQESFELSPELGRKVQRLAQEHGATSFMVYMAAYYALLYRITYQEDILIGTPVANRDHPSVESLVGLFINTVVIRTCATPDTHFQDLLRMVKKSSLEAFEHATYPFGELVDELRVERDLSRNPLFQVMFVLQSHTMPDIQTGDLKLSPLILDRGTTQVDLTLSLIEESSGVKGYLEFNTHLFQRDRIKRLAQNYQTLLESIVAHTTLAMDKLPLLTDTERQQVLLDWNQTDEDYGQHGVTLQDLFDAQVARTPEAPALIYKDLVLTYTDLARRANQLGHFLQARGVGRNVLVGICMERSIEMVLAMYGIQRAGGAYAPIDPELPAERVAYMVGDARVPVLLTQEHLLESIPPNPALTIALDKDWDQVAAMDESQPPCEIQPIDLAYMIYTSGSTGNPKGVMNCHEAICNRLLWKQKAYQINASDRVLQKTPYSFDVSVWEFFWPMQTGACLVIAQPGGHKDSDYLVDIIDQQQITTMHFVPSMLQIFLENNRVDQCSSLKRVICSGEALPLSTSDRFFQKLPVCELHNLYGPTEAAVDVTFWECKKGQSILPIGKPIDNIRIFILDKHLNPPPIGASGELHIAGIGLARGYHARPSLTAEKFIPDPYSSEPGARMYKTGDAVRYLSDGNIDYIGRIDFQVKLRGLRIELGEISTVLDAHQAVKDSLMLVHGDGEDKILVAYWVAVDDQDGEVSDLRRHIHLKLPDYMVPSVFIRLDSFPTTPNGKVDRRALPAPEIDRSQLDGDRVKPSTDTQAKLYEIWQPLVKADEFGVHDNFFHLGGHSLLATRAVSRINDHFRTHLNLASFFKSPTIAGLETLINQAESAAYVAQERTIRPMPPDVAMPLSLAQNSLWFIDKLQPNNAAYNIFVGYHLRGSLSREMLQQALDHMVARHQTLRTSFPSKEGKPCLVIADDLQLELTYADCSDNPEQMEQIALAEAQTAFNIATGPLVRFSLIRVDDEHHVFLLNMHHIISDGWSLDLFLSELLIAYTFISNNQPPIMPELAVQYTDYAYWQRRWLQGKNLETSLQFWKDQLSGAPFILDLPTDKSRPMVQSFKGAYHRIHLDEQITKTLRVFAENQGVTPFMTLLSVFGVLLSRYARQTDLLIGSPIAGRNHTEIEGLIGFFVNSLVLRLQMGEHPNFVALLADVRETTLAAWANSDLPFDLLVEHLQPDRDLSRNPLFQAMFSLQEKGPAVTDGPFSVEAEYFDAGVSHFDLTLSFEGDGENYAGIFEYNTDLFEASTIQRLANHYQNLLNNLIADPNQVIAQVPMMDAEERQRLVDSWNNSSQSYDPQRLFHHVVAEYGRKTPAAPAFVYQGKTTSFDELNRRANQLAHHLRELGVGPDTIVGISMKRSTQMYVALLAILKAGGAYLSLDPSYPSERLEFMIADTNISIIVAANKDSLSALPPHKARVFTFEEDANILAAMSDTPPPCAARPHHLAYVIYTSGTTGKPKGVMITHRGLTNLLVTQQHSFKITPQDRVLVFASLNFDAAIFLLTWGWQFGAAVYTAPKEELLGKNLENFFIEHEITTVLLPPSVLPTLNASKLPKLRHLITGGEAISAEQATTWASSRDLVNAYGPTEVTVWGTWTPLDGQGSAPIGKPVANASCYIVDKHLHIQPIGVPGELLIAGDGLARGYLRRPSLTSQMFIPNPFATEHDVNVGSRLYRTGDLTRWRADGNIEYLGRIDHQVKIRGFRVEPDEIASRLLEHEAVRDALVMAREDRPGDLRLVAYMVLEGAHGPTTKELRTFLGDRLPDHMIPSACVTLDAWPLTADGSKVDRRALPKPGNLVAEEGVGQPRSEVEAAIVEIWKALLQVDQVGIGDNFFDLGGHSLLLAQAQSQISEKFEREIAITDLFQYPTVGGLAEFLSPGHVEKTLQVHQNKSSGAGFSDIAIVGMAGRFPMAENVDQFWENLKHGKHCITFFSTEELQDAGVEGALLHNPDYVRASGYLKDIDTFDAMFFGYSPRDARILDPQQRQFLQGAWHALEHAGYNPESYDGRISLFAGTSSSSYMTQNLMTNHALVDSTGMMPIILANDKDFLPTRVSYKLNLKGAGINVQTACSTSLVAVHMACMSLLNGECEMAMAGGIRLLVPGKAGYLYEEGNILSPDGHCRAFDQDARGVLSGSGYGLVVLKPLPDALASNDTVHALIKGSAVNNDGSDKIGFTAPSIEGQAQVIAQAQAVGNIDPETIGYIEAHGTGTELGDPIEIAALTRAFNSNTDRKGFCAIASAKTNMGHLDAAAGVTGLIKAALTLKHGQIPASLHFNAPNPKIDFANSPFFVNTELREFPKLDTPRRAGVSSFGLGGTNAHAVLEEPPCQPATEPGKAQLLLPISAKHQPVLEQISKNLMDYLEQQPSISMADAAYTLQVGRASFKKRAFLVCRDRDEALEKLEHGNLIESKQDPSDPKLVFMFSGQGSQYVNMARHVYENDASFRADLDYCCEQLSPHLNLDLRDYLYPDPNLDPETMDRVTTRLNQTDLTQPALFSVSYCLAKLLNRWGVEAQAMIGHSIGELAAATLCGVFELEDALSLVATRGRLMQSQPPGDMLAVPLPEAELQPYLVGRHVCLAAVNGGNRCVVSGPSDEIAELTDFLKTKELACRILHTSHAFHSQMMDNILEPFATALKGIKMRAPHHRFISNVTGDWITAEQATNPYYWAEHLRGTVRFAQGIDTLVADGHTHFFLEVGPGKTLVSFVNQQLDRNAKHGKAQTIRHPKTSADDFAFLTEALGHLWLAGCQIDWTGYYGEEKRRRIPLPTYPFQKDRFWVEPGETDSSQKFGALHKRFNINEWFYLPGWKRSSLVDCKSINEQTTWMIFEDKHGLGQALTDHLQSRGDIVTRVKIGQHFEMLSPGCYSIDPSRAQDYESLLGELSKANRIPSKMLHFWNITRPDAPVPSRTKFADVCAQRGFFCMMHLVQTLEKLQIEEKIQVGVVTNGMQEINDGELSFPEKATLLGAIKVIPREHPDISMRSIDILMPDLAGLERLTQQLLDEMNAGAPDTVIALRGRHRWVQTFEQVELKQNSTPRLREGGTYLITGGLTGVGLMFAQHLAKTTKARLVLTRRSPFPRREDWDQWLNIHGEDNPISQTIGRLREMEKDGAAILAINGDVANVDQMRNVIDQARKRFGKIHGVFHAAGVLPSGMFSDMSLEAARRVFQPKVAGTLVMAELLGDEDLDFLVLFSSTSAILGNMGYGDYVAANAFLDAFAQNQAALPYRVTVSVNWDGWQEVGMAIGRASDQSLANAISNKEGREVLDRLMASEPFSQVIVSTMDLQHMVDEIRQFMGAQATGDLADELEKVHAVDPVQHRSESEGAFSPPASDIEKKVAAHWCEALGFDKVGLQDDFYELGGDSLLGTMLATKLRKVFKVKFGARLISELPSVAQQAAYIEEQLNTSLEPKRPAFVEPHSDTQKHLANEMQDVLGVQQVGLKDCFKNLGGNLAKAVSLADRLTKSMDLPITAEMVMDTVNLEELAENLETLLWASGGTTTHDEAEDITEFDI